MIEKSLRKTLPIFHFMKSAGKTFDFMERWRIQAKLSAAYFKR